MKQRFTLLPALWSALVVMLFAAPPASADVTEDQLEFTKLEDNTWEVKAGWQQQLSGVLVIPASHEGLPVTSIADWGFDDQEITGVDMPNTIKRIGKGSFANCNKITNINLPEGVTRLETLCFNNCTSLERIDFPKSITELGEGCFASCDKLKKIELPSSVARIEDSCFTWCEGLTEITLSESLEYIGSQCFFRCTALKELVLPRSLTYIGANAFGCVKLDKLTVHCSLTPENSNLSELEDNCLILKEIVFDCETAYLPELQFKPDYGTKVILTYNVVDIPDRAFKLWHIGSVVIPSTVRHIGTAAFASCEFLEDVEIKEGIASISDGMFMGCKGLKNILLPQSVTSIGAFAFYGCPIKKLVCPDSLETIGNGAFAFSVPMSACGFRDEIYGGDSYGIGFANSDKKIFSMTEVVFPENTVSIGDYSFREQGVMDFTLKASKIGDYAFEDCSELCKHDITVCGEEIGAGAFRGTKIERFVKCEGVKRIGEEAFIGALNIATLKIPDSVEDIGRRAFSECTIGKLILGKGLTEIGPESFSGMSALSEVTWSEGLKSIGEQAFFDCNLSSLVLPEGLEQIGARAFFTEIEENAPLVNVTIPASVKEVGESCFGDKLTLIEMYAMTPMSLPLKNLGYDSEKAAETLVLVPRGAKEAYLEDPMWVGFCIKERDTGKVTITMDENMNFQDAYEAQTDVAPEDVLELKIIGPGFWLGPTLEELQPFVNVMVLDLSEVNLFDLHGTSLQNKKSLKKLILPDKLGSASILQYDLLNGCVSLEYIKLPDNLWGLGSRAFSFCYNLREVIFPSELRYIYKDAFCWSGIMNVDLSCCSMLESVGSGAFCHCRSLRTVSFENTHFKGSYDFNLELGRYVLYDLFEGCINLREVKMRDSEIEDMDGNWFNGCISLKKVDLPKNLKTLSDRSFYNTPSLENIELPETLKSIGAEAFGCSGIRSIVIPSGVEEIGEGAFSDCLRLVSVTLPKSCSELADNVFMWSDIKHITSPAFTAPKVQEDTFDPFMFDRCNITAPNDEKAIESYTLDPMWGKFRTFDFSLVIDSEMDDEWVDTSVMDPDTYDDVKDDITNQEEEDEKNNPDDPENASAPRRVNEAVVREKLLRTFAPIYDRMATTCSEGNRGCYVHIQPKGEAKILKVEFDGKDITSELKDGLLLLPPITKSGKLKITTDRDGTSGVGNAFIGKCEKGVIYDLHGRRVLNPGKGIYIKDGKKIVL